MLKPSLTILVVIMLLSIDAFSQSYTISGTLEDASTGEQLVAANIYESSSLVGTITNYYGFYSIKLPKGKIRLVYSYVGYQAIQLDIDLGKDTIVNLSLTPSYELEEVVITDKGPAATVQSTQMSMIKLPIEQAKKMPVLLGETDVLKTIQLLPGVQSGTEGLSGIYVRGGSPDQNLILLDGVPVYNVNHLFGFFSVFNADAIQNVSLIKGGFPARYGGRLSSVLDIKMKEGNMKEFKGEGSIGLISSRLTLEGPIIKDKTSFLISGRRTYIDILTWPIQKAYSKSMGDDFDEIAGYFFHDINAKVNHKFSPKSRLYLSVYTGLDKAYMRYKDYYEDYYGYWKDDMEFSLSWGNITSALRWNYILSPKLFSNVTLTYSRYKIDISDEYSYESHSEDFEDSYYQKSDYLYSYISGIRDWGSKIDFDFIPSTNHTLRFGANNTYHTFSPGMEIEKYEETGEFTESLDTAIGNSKIYANEMFIYIEDEIKLGSRIKTNLGVHYSNFFVKGELYHSIQPRASLRYMFTNSISAKVSYAEMTQYIHLLTNSSMGMPTDLWVPATQYIRPQKSKQVALGTAFDLGSNFELTLEGYYKTMKDVIEYKEGAEYFEVLESWENKIESGKGWAYGSEIMLQKQTGKTTGWVSYTLSWANRQFQNISFGEVFPFKYDRRHDISIVVTHKFNDRIDAGMTWVYGTGYRLTLGEEMYQNLQEVLGYLNLPYWYFTDEYYYSGERTMVEHIERRNDYKMPDYHRMDIGVNFHKQKKHFDRTLSLGAYNVYNRQNAFMIFKEEYYRDYYSGPTKKTLKQFSLFPIIPYFKYSISF